MSFEEHIIAFVKEHEYLYNTKSRSYKNSNKRAVAWESIGKSLNRPVQDCKQRWRSLRDRFSREHKNMTSFPSGSGASFDINDKWEYYDCLDFLIPSLITRKQIGNCETETNLPAVIEEIENVPITPDNNGISPTPKNARATTTKRKVAEETFKNFMDGLNATVAAHLNEPTVEVDVDSEFMQNMAKKMKPLPESVKIHLHATILGIINEELLKFLNNDIN